jgi:serine O-acetyltransferase
VASSTDDMSLFALVREDLGVHGGELSAPGFQALAVYRFGHVASTQPGFAGKVMRFVHRVLFVFVRNVYGIELHASTVVGRRLEIGHQHGIVIHPNAVLGDDCVLRHNVTIGIGVADDEPAPRFGDRVKLSPGAVVLGGVTVGDDVRIGPNTFVTSDVPSGAHVLEPPTRVLQLTKSHGNVQTTAPAVEPVAHVSR